MLFKDVILHDCRENLEILKKGTKKLPPHVVSNIKIFREKFF